jgi:glycosyltransferase involved in cell wall biosynthesis
MAKGSVAGVGVLNVRDWSVRVASPDGVLAEHGPSTLRHARESVVGADIVHFNAVYPVRFLRVWLWCLKARIPYVVSPRGNLSHRSKGKGRIKKTLAGLIAYNHFLAGAAHVHFLTEEEADSSVRFHHFSIIGNSVAVPPRYTLPEVRPITFGFLGRLAVFHKGLDLLLEAVALVSSQLRDAGATLELVGSDDEGSVSWLQRRISQLGIADVVQISGPVRSDQIDDVFRRHSVFVHTSRYEGQPLAVLEALARARPCLVTPGTNMVRTISGGDLGWVAEGNPTQIGLALVRILRAGDGIRAKAQRCRHYAEEELRPDREAEQLLSLYRRVLFDRRNSGTGLPV